MTKSNKNGYVSVTLGNELLEKVQKHSIESGFNNKSLIIRRIINRYYNMKDNGIDILNMDIDELR